MLSCDAFFQQGPHHPCQDYALAARVRRPNRELACAVLADGCSASPHSDVGARILCFALLKALRHEAGDLQAAVLDAAAATQAAMGLPSECLDATLLGLACDGEQLQVMAWGDGMLCLPSPLGGAIEIQYPSGAPYYLSYELDRNRKKQYLKEFGDELVVGEERRSASSGAAFYASFELGDEPVTAAILSDGIASFPTELSEVFPRFTEFKNVHGQFVQRRFRRAMRECKREALIAQDDLACAAIHCNGEPQ